MRKLTRKNQDAETYYLQDTGKFPNSPLPVIHYRKALNLPPVMPGLFVRKLFKKNKWSNCWKSGIFEFNHYHSNTHEVLGFIKGKALLLLGGENGLHISVSKGDVMIIPAGVAHRNLNPEHSITCIGAYPDGKEYDMNYGKAGERPATDERIRNVPLPETDPVFGPGGKLAVFWK